MLTGSQKVDLEQMGIARQNLPLLPPIELAALTAGGFVPGAQHLDDGDHAPKLGQGSDLDKALDDFVLGHGDHPG